MGDMALVTGGASGIGREIAKEWISRGRKVILLDVKEDSLHSAMQDLGQDRCIVSQCDVTSPQSVDAALHDVAALLPEVTALFNCAGVGHPGPTSEVTEDDFMGILDIHLGGTMRLSKAMYPYLSKRGGAIVNVSSVASRFGMPERASYCAAKSAIDGFTRTTAVEWASHGIRVNSVAPGYTSTALTQALIQRGALKPERILARTPMRRFAEPSEIAHAAIFLASPEASFITGQTLFVDGGLSIDGGWY